MEIIQKQSLQSSAIHILGALVGALSTIFIYPLDLSLYGIYGFLTNTASLLVPFITLGFGSVLLKYFPYFNCPEKKHFGFLGYIFSGYAIGILLFAIVFCLFYPEIFKFLSQKDAQIKEFVILLLPLTILYVIFELFSTISINFQKITIPAFTVFILKIILPLLFIFCIQGYLSKFQFASCICLYYLGVILWLIIYLKKIGKLRLQFKKEVFYHPLSKQMIKFAAFSVLGGASAIIALRIDSILITSLLGTEANGQFTLAIFICNVAYIPATALTDTLNSVVSGISKNNNSIELQNIYAKSSKNMLIPTLWISICIYVSFLSLSQIMPSSDKVAMIHPAVGWLLLARIIDAATGVNHHILSYSKYYTLELYLLILMASLNIFFNYILLPKYGINGAAFATLASVCIYNLLKTGIVYAKLKIHPFSKSLGIIFGLGAIISLVLSGMILPFSPLFNILTYSILTSLFFLGVIYYFQLSVEFNALLKNIFDRIKQYFTRVCNS